MQLFGLKLSALRSRPIRRGLDVMNELRAGLLVGSGHQFAKCAVDAHKQAVARVITDVLD
jgi:hypothetical protein